MQEIAESIIPFIERTPKYQNKGILERLVEPERTISFRVVWLDDENNVRVNKGYRVEFSSSLGPYKGGLRFHPSVNLSILKFLGFEQTFKNSLTTLSIGSGKGGSDFDPKGKSDAEVMRFCQSFMTELHRYLGPTTDIPAGDIGVGGREIGYLFGQYKRLRVEFTGTLTGKGIGWGGSCIRPQATGYGLVYFVVEMLRHSGEKPTDNNKPLRGLRVLISGAGNVAQHAVEKCIAFGATVLSMSDSSGCIVAQNGIDSEMLEWIKDLKNNRRGRISEAANHFKDVSYHEGKAIWDGCWEGNCDLALPCAAQNEIDEEAAVKLLDRGCHLVAEGANMPCTAAAIKKFQSSDVCKYAPGKASNAGGVAISGMEMAQNAMHLQWKCEEVDQRLGEIMQGIHATCVKYGTNDDGRLDYVLGANIGGLVKVADAMLDQGVV